MSTNEGAFSAWASEVTGESSDRPVRPYIEQRIRALFDAMDHKRWDEFAAYLSPDVKMICELGGPETVWHMRKNVVDRLRNCLSDCFIRTVPRLIIVDRGRVTSYNTEFEACPVGPTAHDEDFEIYQFTEMAEVAIMDLDDEYRVKRMEFFKTDEKKFTYEGDLEYLYSEVDKAKEAAARVIMTK